MSQSTGLKVVRTTAAGRAKDIGGGHAQLIEQCAAFLSHAPFGSSRPSWLRTFQGWLAGDGVATSFSSGHCSASASLWSPTSSSRTPCVAWQTGRYAAMAAIERVKQLLILARCELYRDAERVMRRDAAQRGPSRARSPCSSCSPCSPIAAAAARPEPARTPTASPRSSRCRSLRSSAKRRWRTAVPIALRDSKQQMSVGPH